VIVSHVGLNDQVVEGLTALDIPAFSVQYHPEAAAGPHDSAYLFDRFVELMTTRQPVTVPAEALAAVTTGAKEN
jgi:carbamoyl-phosphate synthase small subunit